MQIARYQHNMPQGPQINVHNCNCNCGNGGNIWGFNPGGMPPIGGNPFGCGGFGFGNDFGFGGFGFGNGFGGFGFGNNFGIGGFGFGNGFSFGGFGFGNGFGHGMNDLFKTFAIAGAVESSTNCVFNIIDNILGWCGIRPAGSNNYSDTKAEQEEAAKKQQQAQKDADLLTRTLKDTDETDYEISANDDGTVTVTITDKTGKKANRICTGSAQSILNDLGYLNNGEITQEERTELEGDFKNKFNALTAEDAENKLEFPEGYDGNYEATVDKNGNVTVKFKPAEGTEGEEIVVTGKNVDEAIGNIKTKFEQVKENQQLQKAKTSIKNSIGKNIQEAKQNGSLNLPDGYSLLDDIAVDDDKTKITVQIKCPEGSNPPTIAVTANKNNIIVELNNKCRELFQAQAQDELDHTYYELPEGYKVFAAGEANLEKSDLRPQATFVLENPDGSEPQTFNNAKDLRRYIDRLWLAHTEVTKDSEYPALNGTTKHVESRTDTGDESGNYYTYTNKDGVDVAKETNVGGTKVINFNTADGSQVHHRIAKLDDVEDDPVNDSSKESKIKALFTSAEGEQEVNNTILLDKDNKVRIRYQNGHYYNRFDQEVSEEKVMKFINKHSGLKTVSYFKPLGAAEVKAEAPAAEENASNNQGIVSLSDFATQFRDLTAQKDIAKREQLVKNEKYQNRFNQIAGDPNKTALAMHSRIKLKDGTQITLARKQDMTTHKYYWDVTNIIQGK